MTGRTHPPTRRRTLIGVSAVCVLVGLASGWSIRALTAEPTLTPTDTFTTIDTVYGTVERSIDLDASAVWQPSTVIPLQTVGTITAVHAARLSEVNAGDALFDVNLEPVVVMQGIIPAFRTLAQGMAGADVMQVQEFLQSAGFRQSAPNAAFDQETAVEVSNWQQTITSQGPLGEVGLGSVVFVPQLPATLLLGDSMLVGTNLIGPGQTGAEIEILPASPNFTISLPPNQALLVSPGMVVELSRSGTTWQSIVESIAPASSDGSQIAMLRAPEGSNSICGSECQSIPPGGDGSIPASVRILEPVSGVTVPTTAIKISPDGTPAVTSTDGRQIQVSVVASANGMAVLTGISAGQTLRVSSE